MLVDVSIVAIRATDRSSSYGTNIMAPLGYYDFARHIIIECHEAFYENK